MDSIAELIQKIDAEEKAPKEDPIGEYIKGFEERRAQEEMPDFDLGQGWFGNRTEPEPVRQPNGVMPGEANQPGLQLTKAEKEEIAKAPPEKRLSVRQKLEEQMATEKDPATLEMLRQQHELYSKAYDGSGLTPDELKMLEGDGLKMFREWKASRDKELNN